MCLVPNVVSAAPVIRNVFISESEGNLRSRIPSVSQIQDAMAKSQNEHTKCTKRFAEFCIELNKPKLAAGKQMRALRHKLQFAHCTHFCGSSFSCLPPARVYGFSSGPGWEPSSSPPNSASSAPSSAVPRPRRLPSASWRERGAAALEVHAAQHIKNVLYPPLAGCARQRKRSGTAKSRWKSPGKAGCLFAWKGSKGGGILSCAKICQDYSSGHSVGKQLNTTVKALRSVSDQAPQAQAAHPSIIQVHSALVDEHDGLHASTRSALCDLNNVVIQSWHSTRPDHEPTLQRFGLANPAHRVRTRL